MIGLGYLWLFLALVIVGLPVVFALALAPVAGFPMADRAAFLNVLPQKVFYGINQFPLSAIPLFILAGELMSTGGITERIVRFAQALVGHLREPGATPLLRLCPREQGCAARRRGS